MLAGGEDPRYIARRLTRFAAEDIGMADPNALTQALAGWETYERLGSPEGDLAIAQVVVYLGTAPKSNAIYTAFGAAKAAAKGRLADAAGAYPERADAADEGPRLRRGIRIRPSNGRCVLRAELFPDGMQRERFYRPRDRGFEREVASGWSIGTSCGRSGRRSRAVGCRERR